MSVKTKMNEYVAAKREGNKGFTLVELIVVIAILAILAGIAIPAYSGYIEKANKAADEQLLADVNMAFASACAINGQSHINRTTNPSLTKDVQFSDNDPNVVTSFEQFFECEDGAGFKTMSRFEYVPALGVFKGHDSVFSSKADWSGLSSLASFYQGGSYKNSGIAALSGTVDNLTTLLAGDTGLDLLKGFDGFKNTLSALGLSVDADEQTLANAAVVYAAQNLSNVDADAFLAAFEADEGQFGTNVDTYLKSAFNTTDDTEYNLLKTALQYGMAQSYVDSLSDDDEFEIGKNDDGTSIKANAKEWFANNPPTGLTDAAEIMNIVTTDANGAFTEYILFNSNNAGQNDLNLFLGMMDVIDQNVEEGGFDSLEGTGLYSSAEVQNMLNQYLNSQGTNGGN